MERGSIRTSLPRLRTYPSEVYAHCHHVGCLHNTTKSDPGEPVWPNGKAGKRRGLGSNPLRALLSLQKLWSVDTVL